VKLVVSTSDAGRRLAQFLADKLPDLSRTQTQKLITDGAVRVDGVVPPRGAKTKVHRGVPIEVTIPEPEPLELLPEAIPLDILHEDDDVVVVNKQRDLVVHPAPGHPNGTLVNALLHHVADFERPTEEVRPGIVHRLDRDTTGVMIVAKNRRAHQRLVERFAERKVHKVYVGVCHGLPNPPAGTIDTLFARHPRDRKRFSSRVHEGKRAVTHYETAERYVGAARLAITLETGRTHQIRVHFNDAGHPLVGDPTYGHRKKITDPRVREAVAVFDRPALHAARLALRHPTTDRKLAFDAPLPGDMLELMERLRQIQGLA